MRTTEQIIERLKAASKGDIFGFESSILLVRLDFTDAKPFLKEDATGLGWEKLSRERQDVLAEMLGYMPFAWDKANNRRGISAWRSLAHYKSWLWLLDDDQDYDEWVDPYEFYGKPNLIRICEAFGWDWRQWDDGERANS